MHNLSAYVPSSLGRAPAGVVIFVMFLWVMAGLLGMYLTRREGVNRIMVRAGILGLVPQGRPTRQRYTLGPFDFSDRDQKIWSLPVTRNGRPAVLWIRYDSTAEDVIVVEEDGSKVGM